MILEPKNISQLIDALPEQFPFYHLGNVEMTPVSLSVETELPNFSKLIEDHHVVAFALQGELKALLLIAFDHGLDIPTYTELGNILASQLANRLSEEVHLDVLISPPIHMTQSHIDLLVHIGSLISQRSYRHLHNAAIVEIKTILVVSSHATPGSQGRGNA